MKTITHPFFRGPLSYTVEGSTLRLDAATTARCRGENGNAARFEIAQDARLLATALGVEVVVLRADGSEVDTYAPGTEFKPFAPKAPLAGPVEFGIVVPPPSVK